MDDNNNTMIIAELSANHNNNYALSVKTIEAIASAGADAVKVQTYRPESLTLDLMTGYFAPRSEGLWKGVTPWQLYKDASMPYEWHPRLKKIAENLGLVFFSSPFDLEGVDYLEKLDVPMYKIASLEITDIPLIQHTASKGKPMIMSTGVAEIRDIELALAASRKAGNNDITLLKCTSTYPAPIRKANLLTIPDMKDRFGVKVGVSDHSMGSIVPITSVVLGARIVEKHFILDRNLGGPDSSFSMEPDEFGDMVKSIREVEKSMGKIDYSVSKTDKNRRRSLFVVKDVKAGENISEKNVRSIRPGHGLHPKYYKGILGKYFSQDVIKGTPLKKSMVIEL
jgi:pseudaminic acid synthase